MHTVQENGRKGRPYKGRGRCTLYKRTGARDAPTREGGGAHCTRERAPTRDAPTREGGGAHCTRERAPHKGRPYKGRGRCTPYRNGRPQGTPLQGKGAVHTIQELSCFLTGKFPIKRQQPIRRIVIEKTAGIRLIRTVLFLEIADNGFPFGFYFAAPDGFT